MDTNSIPAEKTGKKFQNPLTEGPILKGLLIIALPIILSNLLQNVLELVDMYFIGHLGDDAIAAGTTSASVIMVLMAIMFGVNTAGAAFISRAYGSKKFDRIKVIISHLFYVGILFGIIFAIIGIFFTEQLFVIIGADPAVIAEGVKFLRPALIGSVVLILLMLLTTVFQSTGDSKTPMFVMIIVNIINIVLNPSLIQGLWIFEPMGIAGSAYASLISRGIGLVLLILAMYLLPSKRDGPLKFPKKLTFEPRLLRDIIFVGIPSAIQSGIRAGAFLGMTVVITTFGTAAMAAYGICGRLDMLGYMLVMGLCTGVAVMVGQNLGFNKPDRAKKVAKYAIIINASFMFVVGILYLIFAKNLLELFGATADSLAAGTLFMQIVPFSYFIIAAAMTMGFAMNGAGKTMPGMIAALVGQLIFQVGLSALFTYLGFPLQAVWFCIFASGFVVFGVDLFFFLRGSWLKKKLDLGGEA